MPRLFIGLTLVAGTLLLDACTSTDVPVPFNCEESDLSLAVEAVQGATSCDTQDGALSTVASGGEAPLAFSLNDEATQPDGNFTGLRAGVYIVKVTDAHQCTVSISNVNVEAAGFSITTGITPDNSCLDGTGSVEVQVTDGNPPFQFRLEDGNYVDNNLFGGLQEGGHKITVRDNNGCEVALNVTVPRGSSGVSWKNEILPIVETNCAINDCHNGLLRPDLTKYEKAHFYAALMKKLTQDRSMPFDGSITQDQIDLIACWVDDGAPNN